MKNIRFRYPYKGGLRQDSDGTGHKRINELKNDQVMAQIALNTVVLELEAMTAGKMTAVQPVQKIKPEPDAEKSAPETKLSTAKKKTSRTKS